MHQKSTAADQNIKVLKLDHKITKLQITCSLSLNATVNSEHIIKVSSHLPKLL